MATGVARSTNVERNTLRAAEVGSNATRAIGSLPPAPGICAQDAVVPRHEALDLRAREVRHGLAGLVTRQIALRASGVKTSRAGRPR